MMLSARSVSLAGAAVRLRLPAAATAARSYHANVVDHYENPRNVGSMDKKDLNVGTGLVGAPACGDVMKLQVRVSEDGRVEEAVFKVRPLIFAPQRGEPMLPTSGVCILLLGVRCLFADVWVRLGDRELVVHDGVAQGEDTRRVQQHQEFGHCKAPQAAACQAALLHVRRPSALPCPLRSRGDGSMCLTRCALLGVLVAGSPRTL